MKKCIMYVVSNSKDSEPQPMTRSAQRIEVKLTFLYTHK